MAGMICAKCGETHPLEDMELTFRRPDAAAQLSADERARLVQENSDLCVIEGKRFFIRAVLPLPVDGRELDYCIGLWVEVDQVTFDRVYDLWESEDQLHEPPLPAHIANEVPTAAGSLGLEAQLRLSGPTVRPRAFLKPGTHQLYREQTQGIDAHRIAEYTALFT